MDDNAVGLHKRCGTTAFFVIFAKKSGARLSNCYIAQIVGGGIINLAEKPQNTKREVKIMRRKKLLRQVAAAAVALSMAVSLSAPAFAAKPLEQLEKELREAKEEIEILQDALGFFVKRRKK